MSFYGLLTFCAVYALAVATPGPGVAAIIARSLAHGFKGAPAFVASLMLTLANPKAILFFLALLPTVVDLASMNVIRFVEISLAISIVLPAVLFSYVFLAARAREMFTTPKAVRRLNRSSGVAMAGAAVVVATR